MGYLIILLLSGSLLFSENNCPSLSVMIKTLLKSRNITTVPTNINTKLTTIYTQMCEEINVIESPKPIEIATIIQAYDIKASTLLNSYLAK